MTANPLQEEPGKHKVRPDPHRVMAWVDGALQRRPVQIALLIQMVLLLALLLGPRLWGRESIATRIRVGDRAEGNIKASQNFDYYPSAEKLELGRSEAAAKILPVFDHQADLGPILLSRVGRAFNAMAPPPDSGPARVDAAPAVAKQPRAMAKAKVPPPPSAAEIEEKRRELAGILQVEVPLETFEQLRKAHFSSDSRAALLGLIGGATSQYVVAHRNTLIPFGGQPVTVRHMVGGRTSGNGEERVANLAQIKGLSEVHEEVRVQAPIHVAKLPPAVGKSVAALAQSLVATNLSFNQEETDSRREAARDAIQSRPITIVRGQVILRDGDPVTKEHLSILKAMDSWHKGSDVAQVLFGLALALLILLAMIYRYAASHFRRFILQPRDMLAMGVLLVGLVGLAKLAVAGGEGLAKGQEAPVIMYALPVAGGAMLVRLLISAEAAAIFATVLAATCGILVDQGIGVMLYYLVVGLMGAAGVTQVQSRSTILRAGFAAGLVGALLVVGLRMFREQLMGVDTLWSVLAAVGGGLLSSFVTLALLPLMEWLFAYTTDVTLLELANLNHPLLRELILRAPGTYHHSMVVGSLSESACEAIGANGLLARVACYYHDVGKMRNADYFAENFKPGDNPHNRLKPSMSALIIRSHVKDTIELMTEHHIPELVIDTATQHHGKTLIEFFYHKAGEAKEADEEVHEEDYRYPGPKPQSREAGVIMLADGVEAAARSLAEPTEDRLVAVVQRVTNNKFTDGQLDHCDLTLRDLHMIAKSFLQVLRGIYHQRPTYPWQQALSTQKLRDETKREIGRDTARFKAVEREGANEERPAKTTPKQPHQAQPQAQKNDPKKGRSDPTKTDAKKGKPEIRPPASNGGQGKGDKDKPDKPDKPDKQDHHQQHRSHKITGPMLPVAAQLVGDGLGPPDAEREGAPEAPAEGNADLRRLGL